MCPGGTREVVAKPADGTSAICGRVAENVPNDEVLQIESSRQGSRRMASTVPSGCTDTGPSHKSSQDLLGQAERRS